MQYEKENYLFSSMAKKSPPPRKRKAAPSKKKAAPKKKAVQPNIQSTLPSTSLLDKMYQNRWMLIGGLVLLTFLSFFPVLDNEFINWDDDRYVYENPDIQGFGNGNLGKIFSKDYVSNYQPVTMLSLMANYAMSELKPSSYLFTNVLLHIISTVLVFFFAFRLSRRRVEVGLITAALFALHPMHVESVAWVSERKDVLYTAFFLGGLITYLRYMDTQDRKFYVFTLILFALSVLSKPAAVVFPLVLLLLDYYEKGKIERKNWLDSMPFFAGSLIMGIKTLQTQSATAIIDPEVTTFSQKVLSSFYAMSMYLVKMFAPVKLSAFYPYPYLQDPVPVMYYLGPLLILALAGLVLWLWLKKKNRLPLFIGLFFLINIILVLQFLQVGGAVMADRYTYVPYIGLFFGLGMGVSYLVRKGIKPWGTVASAAMGLAILGCAFGTFQRVNDWQDSGTIWTDVIEKYPRLVPTSYLNRGKHFFVNNDREKAIADWQVAIELDQNYEEAYNNLGLMYYDKKDFDGALEMFNQALRVNPNYSTSLKYRANCYVNKNDFNKAIPDYQKFNQLNPNDPYGHNGLGVCYQNSGNFAEAAKAFGEAIRRNPNNGFYYFNRSVAQSNLGRKAEAFKDAQRAQQLGHSLPAGYLDGLR